MGWGISHSPSGPGQANESGDITDDLLESSSLRTQDIGQGQMAYEADTNQLRSSVRGRVILPDDPDYDNEWRSHYFDSLDPASVSTLIHYLGRLESPWTDIKIPHLGGAIETVPEGGSAFEGRKHRYALVIQARWQDADESEKNLAWTKALQNDLRPFAADGVYLNFLAREESSRVVSAYCPESYLRLQALKGRLDPHNVFRSNPNIPPVSGQR